MKKKTKKIVVCVEFDKSYCVSGELVRIMIGKQFVVFINGEERFREDDSNFSNSFLDSELAMFDLGLMIENRSEPEELIRGIQEFYDTIKDQDSVSIEEEKVPKLSILGDSSDDSEITGFGMRVISDLAPKEEIPIDNLIDLGLSEAGKWGANLYEI